MRGVLVVSGVALAMLAGCSLLPSSGPTLTTEQGSPRHLAAVGTATAAAVQTASAEQAAWDDWQLNSGARATSDAQTIEARNATARAVLGEMRSNIATYQADPPHSATSARGAR